MVEDRQIATIPKNAREELRIGLSDFRGYWLVNMRVWFTGDDRAMRPGKAGLVVRIEKLADLLQALQRADMEAKSLWHLEAKGRAA